MPPGILTLIANFLLQWINPRVLAIGVTAIILVLPILQISGVRSLHLPPVLKKFYHNRLVLLNFLHRIGYTLILSVVLYSVFRQRRPCRCTSDGVNFQHFGSIYGMPSGDAMSGAIFGAFLFDVAPFNKTFSRIVGAIIIPLICMERVVLGYHTIAQVTVGSCLGILLHVYSTRLPQALVFVDAFLHIVVGAILLLIDPALVYEPNSTNNLFSWFVWGVSFEIFVVAMLGRFYFNRENFAKLRFSLQQIIHSKDPFQVDDQMIIMGDIEDHKGGRKANVHSHTSKLGDVPYTLLSFGTLLVINFFSSAIGQYAWFSK